MRLVFWTDERIAFLRAFCSVGMSAAQVAAKLGCTRNAIIGKAHREGIQLNGTAERDHEGGYALRIKPIRKPARAHAFVKPREKRSSMQLIPQAPKLVADLPPANDPKLFLDLDPCDCRWPLGGLLEPIELFCAGPAIDGRPYCGFHCRIAYQVGLHRRAA